MQIPIDKKRLIQVWKKALGGRQECNTDEFRVDLLPRLADASLWFLIEENQRKITKITKVADIVRRGQALGSREFAGKSEADLTQMVATLEDETRWFMSANTGYAFNRLVQTHLTFNEPEIYRLKMPGYKRDLFLLPDSKKQVKKILNVKRVQTDTLETTGNTTGISSLMYTSPSPALKQPQAFSAAEQKESVLRLFRGSLNPGIHERHSIIEQGTEYTISEQASSFDRTPASRNVKPQGLRAKKIVVEERK